MKTHIVTLETSPLIGVFAGAFALVFVAIATGSVINRAWLAGFGFFALAAALPAFWWSARRSLYISPERVSGGFLYQSLDLDPGEQVLLQFQGVGGRYPYGRAIVVVTDTRLVLLPSKLSFPFQATREAVLRRVTKIVVERRWWHFGAAVLWIVSDEEANFRITVLNGFWRTGEPTNEAFAYDFISAVRRAGFSGEFDDSRAGDWP